MNEINNIQSEQELPKNIDSDAHLLSENDSSNNVSKNFIRHIIEEDLKSGKYKKIKTRFPPEPNGYLHIGHSKSIALNFGLARDYDGVCHLRFDDTNPVNEDDEFVHGIQDSIKWLGFDWKENLFFASDYFEKFYEYAIYLIKKGRAYICDLSEEAMREYRGTVSVAGKNSPGRLRTVEENLDLFERMKLGSFPDGAYTLRAKIDMSSSNMKMRDPALYRIRHFHHHRTGNKWCIYPMYDYAHPLSDAIEGITHSICTLEFENNRELYDWILSATDFPEPRPRQYEFARLNLNYTIMSKRKLAQLVRDKLVSNWDDPRMPTLVGMRKRGYSSQAILSFCDKVGVAKANSVVDIALLEKCLRDDLHLRSKRVMAVLHPVKLVIENYPEDKIEWFDVPFFPQEFKNNETNSNGINYYETRKVPFSREIFIEEDDFMENPSKGYFRLATGQEVRLKYAYIVRCTKVIKNKEDKVVELRCVYDPLSLGGTASDGRKIKGTIHWVSKNESIPITAKLYDRLFSLEDPDNAIGGYNSCLNPTSLVVCNSAFIEPSIKNILLDFNFQFERLGFFCTDTVVATSNSDNASNQQPLVFNRIVTLKDSWSKNQSNKEIKQEIHVKKIGEEVDRDLKLQSKTIRIRTEKEDEFFDYYSGKLCLGDYESHVLSVDSMARAFFDTTITYYNSPKSVSNWVINDIMRTANSLGWDNLPISAENLAKLVSLVDLGEITNQAGRLVFSEIIKTGSTPEEIIEKKGLAQISDDKIIRALVEDVIFEQQDSYNRYLQGKTSLFGFFVGQVLKKSNGKANPEKVNQILKERLEKSI